MELPGGGGVWLAPSPSPSGPTVPDRHDEHGVGTFIWPPAGTSTWPPVGTFSWPWTAFRPAHLSVGQLNHRQSPRRDRRAWITKSPLHEQRSCTDYGTSQTRDHCRPQRFLVSGGQFQRSSALPAHRQSAAGDHQSPADRRFKDPLGQHGRKLRNPSATSVAGVVPPTIDVAAYRAASPPIIERHTNGAKAASRLRGAAKDISVSGPEGLHPRSPIETPSPPEPGSAYAPPCTGRTAQGRRHAHAVA
jgi:hypothetical protein